MSDTAWREAARAIRSGVVTPEQFAEALGYDYKFHLALRDAIQNHMSALMCRTCGHYQFLHFETPFGRSADPDPNPCRICGCKAEI